MPVFTEVNLVTAAAVFVLGLLAGALLARLVLPSRQKLRQLMLDLDAARSEHQVYRSEVSHHFEKTSELVATLTASYKAVYDHLAEGAQNLCSENASLGAGRFAAPKLVFDHDVRVDALASGGSVADDPLAERVTPPGRADAPVLEMKRETPPVQASPTTAQSSESAEPSSPDRKVHGEGDDVASSSPLH
jgi:uncharacterized membrane-anchored protein YhcB (DUF1043 family)